MMALATSDFLFCLVLIAGTGQWETFAISKDFEYFYQIFTKFVLNTLVRLSTRFTVILAVSRYYAVVYNPFRARQRMRYIHTLIAILTCIVIWKNVSSNIRILFSAYWKVPSGQTIEYHIQLYLLCIRIYLTNFNSWLLQLQAHSFFTKIKRA